ncbi:MAG: hypothetical protein IPK33_20100 [Gemmatimonadetes bacterium]|nr:hypothetical protein [Gemmatimonadota bacterium]
MLAVVHLLTLGWFTTSIMGALYQFPRSPSVPRRLGRVAHASFALYALWGASPHRRAGDQSPDVAAGGVTSRWCWGAQLSPGTSASPSGVPPAMLWWSLAGSSTFLAVTLLLGASLSANLHLAFLGSCAPSPPGAHLHIALAGWVLLSMVGVSQRLFPMFLLSHGGSDRHAVWAMRLSAAGAGALALLHHVPIAGRWLLALLIPAPAWSPSSCSRANITRTVS